MKKSKKQIPNIKFRKFAPGGTMNFEESTYNSSLPSTNGNIGYMNDKRTKGLSSNQYMAAAGALTTGLGNMSNVYNDSNATSRNKDEALSSTVTGTIGAVNPVVGGIIGVGDAIGKPIRTGLEKTDPNTGKLVNRGGAKAGAVIGSFFSPSKMIGMAAEGNWDITGNKYADNLEKEALNNINAQKAQDAAYNQQMQAQQQQQAQYNLMYQDYQNRNKQFAQGGMNMFPNAEVEKQENSVAPNGQFTQFNGPDHSNGGVKTQLAPGEMVFSDRLKLGKKTFAQLNKSNNTNKEDKILEDSKSGNISTRTAALMKMAKLKASQELFNIQEQLKQSKVENYAKKMGVSLPQMLLPNDQNQQYSYGGMNLPKYFTGGRYVNGVWVEDNQPTEGFQADTWNAGVGPVNNLGENSNVNNLITNEDFDKLKNANHSLTQNQIINQNNKDQVGISTAIQKLNANHYIGESQYLPDNNNVRNNPNLKKDTVIKEPPQSNKTDWKNVAGQVGMGLLQNAGNIYNLSRYNTPEIEKYERVKASYLDPTAAIRDAEQENRRAEVDIRNATSGNAGNYLSNRVALSTKNALNKDRVRQQYANTNAGIANQNSQVNADISMREIIANAQNRARTRSGKEEAISQIGSNVSQQMLDNKKSKMDKSMMEMLPKMMNNPEFQKFYEEWSKKNG